MKIVQLNRHPRLQQARLDCRRVLDETAARVKAGEVESVAIVMVGRDGRAIFQLSAIDRPDIMLGGITRLERAVLELVEEIDVPEAAR